jgi:hypothetical protein
LALGSKTADQKFFGLKHSHFFRSVEVAKVQSSPLLSTSFAWKEFFKTRWKTRKKCFSKRSIAEKRVSSQLIITFDVTKKAKLQSLKRASSQAKISYEKEMIKCHAYPARRHALRAATLGFDAGWIQSDAQNAGWGWKSDQRGVDDMKFSLSPIWRAA